MGMTMASQMMTGDGGNVAVIDGFWLFQGMTNQTQKQMQKWTVPLNPSVHYHLPPLLPPLDPSDPYRYHHHLRFRYYRVEMYQTAIQGVAPGDGVIDEYELL